MSNYQLWVPICAAVIGAALGSFLGFIWQSKKDKKTNKKTILATLMAYRGVGAAEHDWIKALNMIDIYFYGNEKVIHLRREYFKHLYRPLYDTGAHARILLDLLSEMAKDIGYRNLKQSDITDYYFPEELHKLYPTGPDKSAPSSSSPS